MTRVTRFWRSSFPRPEPPPKTSATRSARSPKGRRRGDRGSVHDPGAAARLAAFRTRAGSRLRVPRGCRSRRRARGQARSLADTSGDRRAVTRARQPERAAAIISGQLAEAPGWMTPDRVSSLLATHGLSISARAPVLSPMAGPFGWSWRRHRRQFRPGPRAGRRRRHRRAREGRRGSDHAAVRARLAGDDPLAEDIPAAGRLPWPASGRPRGPPGRPAPGQRDGGGAPGDRRARPASAAGVRDRRGHPSRTRAGRERAAGGASAVAAGLSWVPPRMATVVARGDPSQSPPVSRVYRPLGRSEQPKRPERAFPGRGSGRRECWRAPTSRATGRPGRFWTFWLPTAPDRGRDEVWPVTQLAAWRSRSAAARIPLTNPGASAPQNSLAVSTASSIAPSGGIAWSPGSAPDGSSPAARPAGSSARAERSARATSRSRTARSARRAPAGAP